MEPFKPGDRVEMTSAYYVSHPGDCDRDSAAKRVPIGSLATIRAIGTHGHTAAVEWDHLDRAGGMNINLNCLSPEDTVTEEELADVLKSISTTFQERKNS